MFVLEEETMLFLYCSSSLTVSAAIRYAVMGLPLSAIQKKIAPVLVAVQRSTYVAI